MDHNVDVEGVNDDLYLTPELIGKWLVGEERSFFRSLMEAGQGDHPTMPPLNPSVEAMTEISVHSYALQVAIVCLTYQPALDDSQFLTGNDGGDVDIRAFLLRVQSGAREEAQKHIMIKNPDFDPFGVAGCARSRG